MTFPENLLFCNSNVSFNNNTILIQTCYNCIEQYTPINKMMQRIIIHVMLHI